MIIISIAAIASFLSAANAGILSSSRYPMAMSRDHMVPAIFRKLGRFGTPVTAIVVTVALIALQILLLDPLVIAKYAGTTKLLLFGMLCARFDRDERKQARFIRPEVQGPLLSMASLHRPAWMPGMHGASWLDPHILHRRTDSSLSDMVQTVRRSTSPSRRRHLPSVLAIGKATVRSTRYRAERNHQGESLRPADPFDEIIARAHVLEAKASESFREIALRASNDLAEETGLAPDLFHQQFLEGTRVGATPVMGGVALPHLRMNGLQRPYLVLVRCMDGLDIQVGHGTGASTHEEHVYAMFFMASPDGSDSTPSSSG